MGKRSLFNPTWLRFSQWARISASKRMMMGVRGGGTGFVRLAKSVDGEGQSRRWAHPFVKVGSTQGFGDWWRGICVDSENDQGRLLHNQWCRGENAEAR